MIIFQMFLIPLVVFVLLGIVFVIGSMGSGLPSSSSQANQTGTGLDEGD